MKAATNAYRAREMKYFGSLTALQKANFNQTDFEVRCVIQWVEACRRTGGIWAGRTEGGVGEMCELGVDVLRDIFDRSFTLGEIKKSSIVKKMVRATRGLGHTLNVGFEIRDKPEKKDEADKADEADDAEVMMFEPTATGGLWAAGVGSVNLDDESSEEEEDEEEEDGEEGGPRSASGA